MAKLKPVPNLDDRQKAEAHDKETQTNLVKILQFYPAIVLTRDIP